MSFDIMHRISLKMQNFFKKREKKISDMAPFDFSQIWPKSVSLMLIQIASFIWPPTRHLNG